MILRLLPLALCAFAHVQLLSPTTRNTVDRNLPQWKGGKFGNDTCIRTDWQYTCWGGNCHNGSHICDVGQNFLWFSQGAIATRHRCPYSNLLVPTNHQAARSAAPRATATSATTEARAATTETAVAAA
jgi:hypothetical protein